MKRVAALAVASEITPLVKTGGLADVAGALPAALRVEGVETGIYPGYASVLAALGDARSLHELGHFRRPGAANRRERGRTGSNRPGRFAPLCQRGRPLRRQ